jgi:hypothetical protein
MNHHEGMLLTSRESTVRSESVNQRRTDNTMTKKKDKKRNIYIELKIEQHHIH